MNSRLLLAVSIGLNLGLMALVVFKHAATPKSSTSPTRIIRTNTIVKLAARTITVPAPTPAPAPLDWGSVESEDYRLYIANLRSIGCPDETIKDIIISDVAKLFAKKFREQALLIDRSTPKKFWQTSSANGRNSKEPIAALRNQLEKDQRDLIRDLLGVDLSTERSRSSLEWQPNGETELRQFLNEDKTARITQLREQRKQEVERFRDRVSGREWTPEERAAWTRLQTEHDDHLNQILTSTERAQYDLWFSETATSLRKELAAFEPSEKEFVKLYELRKTFDDALSKLKSPHDDTSSQITSLSSREQAQAAFDQEAQKLLGAARYEEFQRIQNPQFQEMVEWSEQFEADPQAASKLFSIRKTAEEEIEKLLHNSNINPTALDTTLRLIREETESAVAETLGKSSISELGKRYPAWLRQLHPPKKAEVELPPQLPNNPAFPARNP